MNGTLATSGSLAEQLQEARHRRDAVDHPLVHADVDDVGAVLDLLARDAHGLLVLALLDQLGELRRAGDVGALADHHVDAGLLRERLRAGQAQRAAAPRPSAGGPSLGDRARRHRRARRLAVERLGDGGDVLRRVAAAAAGDVDQARLGELAEVARHVRRLEIEAGRRERIGQARVRIAGDRRARLLRELREERIHQVRAERAVEPDRERLHVLDRVPERLDGLRRDHRLAAAPDRRRDHDRQLACRPASKTSWIATSAALALSESKIVSTSSTSEPPAMSARTCCDVGRLHLIERDDAEARVVGVGRVRERHRERPDRAATKRWRAVGVGDAVGPLAALPRRLLVDLPGEVVEERVVDDLLVERRVLAAAVLARVVDEELALA